jgi:predicted DNA-binding transcriptional regulator AlpA
MNTATTSPSAAVPLTVEVPRVLTAPQLAQLLGVDKSQVWRWHREGRLPRPMALPGDLRWSAITIQRWLERGGRG